MTIDRDDLAAALSWISAIDNSSGQICQIDATGKPTMILFEFGCATCSEVASKNVEEYGNALVTLVQAARAHLEAMDEGRRIRHEIEQQNEDRMGWLNMTNGEAIP